MALHSMQNASGVVHHAIRVYRGLELSLDKSLTHILGEARTHEKYAIERFDGERGVGYGYGSLQLHHVERFASVVLPVSI